MNVTQPMYISSRLMAAYDFEDGSTLQVSPDGEYLLEDPDGNTVVEGDDFVPSPLLEADALSMAAAIADFIYHDAELYEFSADGSWGKRYPDSATNPHPEDWVFGPEVGKWANKHQDELSILATMDQEED